MGLKWEKCYEKAVLGGRPFSGLPAGAKGDLMAEVVAPVSVVMEVVSCGVSDLAKIVEGVRKVESGLPTVQPYRSIWDDALDKCPDADDGRVVGFEAGGRGLFWYKEKAYLVPAGVLFGGGRDADGEIGLNVIERAVDLAAEVNRHRKTLLKLSANLSLELLKRESLVGDIGGILKKADFSASNFVFELLENVNLDKESPALIEKIREIVAMGVELAVDDLGTEYSVSNLEVLMKAGIAVAEVKFDGSFSRRMDDEGFWKEIDGYLEMAEKAGAKRVVWEGLASGLGREKVLEIREYHKRSEVGRRWADRALFEGRVV